MGDWSRSRAFEIRAGVRQGCVLSARFCFLRALQWVASSRPAEIVTATGCGNSSEAAARLDDSLNVLHVSVGN